jgi:hypothetical protein
MVGGGARRGGRDESRGEKSVTEPSGAQCEEVVACDCRSFVETTRVEGAQREGAEKQSNPTLPRDYRARHKPELWGRRKFLRCFYVVYARASASAL